MNEELAKRAVACKAWRWMPGMRVTYHNKEWYRIREGDGYGSPHRCVPPNPRSAAPDFTDPATMGCLLSLVREAWGRQLHAEQTCESADYWVVRTATGSRWDDDGAGCVAGEEDGEAAALVAALEAAPAQGRYKKYSDE